MYILDVANFVNKYTHLYNIAKYTSRLGFRDPTIFLFHLVNFHFKNNCFVMSIKLLIKIPKLIRDLSTGKQYNCLKIGYLKEMSILFRNSLKVNKFL